MAIEEITQRVEQAPNNPLEIVEAASSALGLGYLTDVAVAFPRPNGGDLQVFTRNYPAAWVRRQLEQDDIGKDPVVLEKMSSIHPVDWVGLDGRCDVGRRLFGEARAFGIPVTGLTTPIRGLRGERAVLSASADFSRKIRDT